MIRTVVFVAIWAVIYGVILIEKFVMTYKTHVLIGVCSIVAVVIVIKLLIWIKERSRLVKVTVKVEENENQ